MNVLNLRDYAEKLQEAGLVVSCQMPEEDLPIEYLTYDSRDLGVNTLFVCKGAAFKAVYLQDVINRGIQAYVTEKEYENVDKDVPYILVTDIRKAMPVLADMFYEEAWKKLNLVGITGTKGKSTTAYYVKHILDCYLSAQGKNQSGIISSIDTYDGVIFEESHLTTPETLDLHKHFRNAVNSNLEYMEMEVSSQGLKYDRVAGITFDVGVYLNISEDHISPIEHPTFEDYFAAKLKIFQHTKHAVVNLDGDFTDEVLEASKAAEDRMTFSQKDENADIYAYDVRKIDQEIHFNVRTAQFDQEFVLTMPGLFNVENALAAIGTAMFLNIPLEYMLKGLHDARSSGRMEVYASKDRRVIGIVDYAHNRLSFEKLFDSTQIEYPGYGIISIFGCPGKKALLRRRDLGTIAGENSEKVYIVAEDPGLEPFMDISEEVARYVEATGCDYEIIEERGYAIRKAIMTADHPVVLLITGKGNETRQKYGAQYLPCLSDVELTKKYIAEYDAR